MLLNHASQGGATGCPKWGASFRLHTAPSELRRGRPWRACRAPAAAFGTGASCWPSVSTAGKYNFEGMALTPSESVLSCSLKKLSRSNGSSRLTIRQAPPRPTVLSSPRDAWLCHAISDGSTIPRHAGDVVVQLLLRALDLLLRLATLVDFGISGHKARGVNDGNFSVTRACIMTPNQHAWLFHIAFLVHSSGASPSKANFGCHVARKAGRGNYYQMKKYLVDVDGGAVRELVLVREKRVHDHRRPDSRLQNLALHDLGRGLELAVHAGHAVGRVRGVLEHVVASEGERLLRPNVEALGAVLAPLRDGLVVVRLAIADVRPAAVPVFLCGKKAMG